MTLIMNAAASFSLIWGLKRPLQEESTATAESWIPFGRRLDAPRRVQELPGARTNIWFEPVLHLTAEQEFCWFRSNRNVRFASSHPIQSQRSSPDSSGTAGSYFTASFELLLCIFKFYFEKPRVTGLVENRVKVKT